MKQVRHTTAPPSLRARPCALWATVGLFAWLACSCASSQLPDRASFWSTPRRGTNFFAGAMTPEWARAAREAGVDWVRLTTANLPTAGRDHLIGSADGYMGIPPSDLAALRAQLDLAAAEGLPVVLTMLSLPGARWRQHNSGVDDLRLYADERFQKQSADFWRDLAAAVGSHPALVGVNIVNEPRPPSGKALVAFYRRVLDAIRSVDPTLPVMLDVGTDAAPNTIAGFEPLDDPAVIYGVHVYEPWEFVTWRIHKGRLHYPGPDAEGRHIDDAFLRRTLRPVADWQRRWSVPDDRIAIAELGIDRRIQGSPAYLRDTICIAEQQGWHWAFYAFRDWQAMDYEVGYRPLPDGYWEAEERGEPMEPTRGPSPHFDVIRKGLGGTLGADCPPAAD